MNRGINAMNWALNARGLTPTAFRLLINLCSYVNGSDTGRQDYDVWPAISELAERCEISESGVRRHLKELIGSEFIEQVPWVDSDGRTTTNVYRIMVVSAQKMPGGKWVRTGRPGGCQIDTPTEGGGCQGWQGDPATADRCKEPLKGTSEDSPLSLTGEAPPEENGLTLFGQGELTDRPNLLEYVKAKWAALCDDFPRTHRVTAWNDTRRNAIVNRAREWVSAQAGTVDAYETWDQMFAAIRGDPWLRGEGEPSPKYPTPFALDIDYICRPKVFVRTLEKARTNVRDTAATSNPATGRRFGPAEQAARDALRRRQQARAGRE